MKLIELEEGIINLIATQPEILNGEKAKIIAGIKNILDSLKTYEFSVDSYENQDLIKTALASENERLELNFVSYACEVLQENGINILLYVPKYSSLYNNTINKYSANVMPIQNQVQSAVNNSKLEQKESQNQTNDAQNTQNINTNQNNSQGSQGRDYLMQLLKK